MIRASAPGKLMLAGEYTVADPGGPALAVAIDVRAVVTVEPGPSSSGGWRVTSPALSLVEGDPEEAPVIAAALARVPGLPEGGLIHVDSDLGLGRTKPGLGASAAVCVAVLGALKRAAGVVEPPSVWDVVAAHTEAQHGKGSGYDAATALTGGVALFDSTGPEPSVQQVGWPEGLHAAVLFTGSGASSTHLLQRVAHWKAASPGPMAVHRDRMVEAARALVAAWQRGDVGAILDAAANAQEALTLFDRAGGIGIRAGRHAELLAAIEDAGAAARTAGAGGGDCAWALSDDPERLEAAVAAAEALGFQRLDLRWPAEGLRVETADAD